MHGHDTSSVLAWHKPPAAGGGGEMVQVGATSAICMQ